MIYLLIICCIIIGFLGFRLYKKQTLDQQALADYNNQIRQQQEELSLYKGELCDAIIKYNTYKKDAEAEETKVTLLKHQLKEAQQEYDDIVGRKTDEINQLMDEQRKRREQELTQELAAKEALLIRKYEDKEHYYNDQMASLDSQIADSRQKVSNQLTEYENQMAEQQKKLDAIYNTIRQYELEKQEKLFYTIQLPDEYKEDIEFLLTAVAAKVQHPDIISKLVWAEYVKPNLDETFKRIEIKAEPGIYKITNIDSGKAYIGKSTNVKTRIADHFKSAIGIQSIADQAVHHAIRQEGFWNWSIEVITYCEKDKLSELEKYYIDVFKTQEVGYNRNSGG